jgi:hypothetical protein
MRRGSRVLVLHMRLPRHRIEHLAGLFVGLRHNVPAYLPPPGTPGGSGRGHGRGVLEQDAGPDLALLAPHWSPLHLDSMSCGPPTRGVLAAAASPFAPQTMRGTAPGLASAGSGDGAAGNSVAAAAAAALAAHQRVWQSDEDEDDDSSARGGPEGRGQGSLLSPELLASFQQWAHHHHAQQQAQHAPHAPADAYARVQQVAGGHSEGAKQRAAFEVHPFAPLT